jgi:hypothetical protein
LQYFVFPEAFEPLKNYKQVYGVAIGVPSKEVENVVLPPGGFYGCTIVHGQFGLGFFEIWFRLWVPKSEANPDLWHGELESNKALLILD